MSSSLRSACLFLLWLVVSLLPTPVFAAWPRSPIQSGVQATPGQTTNGSYALVGDGAGGAFVLLEDIRAGNLDVYLQRLTSQGNVYPGWPATGVAVCTAAGLQLGTDMIADGAGGVIMTWYDERNPANNGDIYAQRVTGSGTIAPGWPVNGLAVSTAAKAEGKDFPKLVGDGTGGAFIAWDFQFGPGDVDIYGAHVTAAGSVGWSHSIVAPLGVQKYVRLAQDGQGGFFAVWGDSGGVDVFAERVNVAGNVVAGVAAVCTATGSQVDHQVVADGGTGLFVTWRDDRAGYPNQFIYATHLNASLAPTAGWAVNGNQVCTQTGGEFAPQIVRDGADGVLIAWEDYRNSPSNRDIFMQRLTLGGGRYPTWPVNGAPVTQADDQQGVIRLTPDGTGGALVSWMDERGNSGTNDDVYAQRITADGSVAPHWPLDGASVCVAPDIQTAIAMSAPDSAGGALITWIDPRNPGQTMSMTQRIDRFGALGNAEPRISSIVDVPHDQGGAVKLTWDASYLDADPGYTIGRYWIWRATTLAAAQASVTRGGRWLEASLAPGAAPRPGTFMIAAGTAWEYVASQPASGFASYSYVAPTVVDSGSTSLPFTKFMVQARAASSGAFWGSAPDSGLSVDNLAPSAPAPFNGTYSSGSSTLSWGSSPESDVVGYKLYRGLTPGFVPSPTGFVTQTASLGATDSPGSLYWYKVAAVDAHGNLSPFSAVLPSGSAGVESNDLPRVLALRPASPNPAPGMATLAFDLPREATVVLALHDLQGRRVRTLFHTSLAAGRYRQAWDGRGENGARLGAGVYVVTLEAEGRVFRRSLTLLR